MIRRVVKMTFKEEYIDVFLEIYRSIRDNIEQMPGCHSVELMRDINDSSTMFTYSIWEDEEALNAYRGSELFGKTWPRTKALFSQPAEAWSLDFV